MSFVPPGTGPFVPAIRILSNCILHKSQYQQINQTTMKFTLLNKNTKIYIDI